MLIISITLLHCGTVQSSSNIGECIYSYRYIQSIDYFIQMELLKDAWLPMLAWTLNVSVAKIESLLW